MAFINTAEAHEVYVLTPDVIKGDVSSPSPNPFDGITGQETLFIMSDVITIILVGIVLSLSVSRMFEKVFDPFLRRLKKYAPFVGRVTLGLSIIASGYYHASFGPELPIGQDFGATATSIISLVLVLCGMLITLGLLTRIVAVIGLVFFAFLSLKHGSYMLTYVSFLGELALFVILGGGRWSLDDRLAIFTSIDRAYDTLKKKLEPYSFLILRVLFGFAVFFASFYAKFLHSNLAISTINEYHLTNYFPFTPLFLVLGAFIVEALFGICIAIGFEIRFVSIAFTCFILLSLTFFGESVWPHLILFGVNIALFCHGYDKYTLEYAIFERHRHGEPVL